MVTLPPVVMLLVMLPTILVNIKGIVGGSNMMYHCIELDQTKRICEICCNHLLLHLKTTERPIMLQK